MQANAIRVSSLDRAEVELSGNTAQFEIIKKGISAEIDTEKLIATQVGSAPATVANQTAKDGSVEFTF